MAVVEQGAEHAGTVGSKETVSPSEQAEAIAWFSLEPPEGVGRHLVARGQPPG
jgi:hypothetical protein